VGAHMDVMWMRLSRCASDPSETFGHAEPGRIMILINRDEYWQCAFVIPKGTASEIRQRGLASFQREIAAMQPFLRDRVEELRDWNHVSLLTVAVDRLARWSRPGLLCIGDAAHAMSPIGGVGINLAIQDAVATANILGPKLGKGTLKPADLQTIQKRRMFPTVATQRVQVAVQNRVISRVLDSTKPLEPNWMLRLLQRFPVLRRIPARVVGVGFRPEHIAPFIANARAPQMRRAA
jgi:2-polyprenyl-6-methoxyphenol hydroxylase-like FAD-dependent oxidoreductase